MRVPTSTSRRLLLGRVWVGARVVAVLVLAVGGILLITDRPGLEAEYFALGAPWEGKPLWVTVGEPRLDDVAQVSGIVMSQVAFSIRWRGWWDVDRPGTHRLSLDVDDGGYVRIDGEVVVDTGGVFGEPIQSGGVELEPGFHAIEVGLYQRHSEARLAVEWAEPEGATRAAARALPLADLYSGRPVFLRENLREVVPGWSRPYRQLLGAALLIAALLLLRRFVPRFERFNAWTRGRLEAFARPGPRTALLLGLFLLTFLVTLPFTGSLRGGDDSAYLSAATFNTENWFSNRYGHVYLLKLFTGLSGGDPLIGVRVWWSFAFAVTVAALAVAVRSVGTGLQLRTLAATLFVLLSQTTPMGLIGNGFADFSAMMFVTVAVAVYLHGFISGTARSISGAERSPPRHEWHALAIGALTVAAIRSKEVSAALLILPMLFVLVDGHLDWRRLARRLAYWAVGAIGVLVVLMLLDGLVFGDLFLILGGERLENLENMNFPEGRSPRPNADWLKTIWSHVSLRVLWIGVCAAAVVAGIRRCRIELRLLHLLPIAYLMALIALYVRMPHPFSGRMLIPITPVACLMTALILHYAGLDDLSWKRILTPGVLIPGGLLAALVVFFLTPYRLGTLEAADFLPVAYLERFGWAPDHFVIGVLLPAATLLVAGLIALGAGQRRLRVTALAIAFLAIFGAGFEITRTSLVQHHAVQLSDLLVYPWRTFEEELGTPAGRKISLSSDLQWPYRMTAPARSSVARLALGRADVRVERTRDFPLRADMAIASFRAWSRWRRQAPGLERALLASARWDPYGFLVLLRPKEAIARSKHLRQLQFSAEEMPDVRQSLADLANSALARSGLTNSGLEASDGNNEDPSAERRDQLLQRILGSESIPLRRLQGDQLRAAALSADGWTAGVQPAGLIVMNSGSSPLVQQLRLGVRAGAEDYPVRVFVDDGEQLETILFERPGSKVVKLRSVPPGASRLVTVWSDTAWASDGKHSRQRGVRILARVKK